MSDYSQAIVGWLTANPIWGALVALVAGGAIAAIGTLALVNRPALVATNHDSARSGAKPGRPGRLARLQESLGVQGLPAPVFAIAALAWTIILVMLLAGLAVLIWAVLFHAVPEPAPPPFAGDTGTTQTPAGTSVWEYRFLLAQLAAITAVLGAVVAFPVTLNRLRLSTEENATKADALYNDKINAALADLHAQRQVTIEEDGKSVSVWQDDIIRRNGAIDRLEALAHENPAMAPRIARMLATYLRELSAVFPAQDPPAGTTPKELSDWATNLRPARSDMESAAQTLGRLREVEGMTPENLRIDLHGANLQGCLLQNAQFEGADFFATRMEGAVLAGAHLEGASLYKAHLEGADLRWAILKKAAFLGAHLEGADLGGAHLDQSTVFSAARTSLSALKSVDLTGIGLTPDQINSMFGDASVILPETIPRPAHWPNRDLEPFDFLDEWHRYKSNPAAYVRPQDRPDADHS